MDADRRQQRLLEDLRQTEDQRTHLDKLYHSSTAKVAEVESELAHVRQDLSHQIKVLREKLEKEIADKDHQQVQAEWNATLARNHLAKHL
jgi:predicted  nucleic acid-binding Zn-ribbon protein